jgi:formamidopyrimidine-DNA glycosylase
MPELPEVETVVKGLRNRVLNREIVRVKVHHPRIISPAKPVTFQRQLSGKTIYKIDRIGKWIGMRLAPEGCLWAHLGMSGRFLWNDSDKYIRAEFHFDGANVLRFSDMRMFGKLMFDRAGGTQTEQGGTHSKSGANQAGAGGTQIEAEGAQNEVGGTHPPGVTLGPDPINDGVDIIRLREIFHKRRMAVKDVLLDQGVVAGIGNIYASEILFEAKLYPLRKANSLNVKEIEVLAECIVSCLERAIDYGGTTISDFLTLEGEPGGFEEHLKVYGKQGHPCPVCTTPLVRYTHHSRSGIFCPSCQHNDS